MKRLSMFNDGLCQLCGQPAAEGLVDNKGLWCQKHGRIRAVLAFENACFELLHTFPEEYKATLAGVDAYDGTPDHLHAMFLAEVAA